MKVKGLFRFKVFLFFNWALLEYQKELFDAFGQGIEDFCKDTDISSWVMSAFCWKSSNRGEDFWSSLGNKWRLKWDQ